MSAADRQAKRLFSEQPAEQIKEYNTQSPEERAAVEQKYVTDMAIVRRHIQDLKDGVSNAHIVELRGATFYIFASKEGEIIRDVQAFLDGSASG
jgi:hypothetical protein